MIETASWRHRIAALVVDWLASTLVVMAFIGFRGWLDSPDSGWYALAVFVGESALLMTLAGGSFGQLATGLRVVSYHPPHVPLPLLKAFARQILIALVIPPLVFRPDGRGVHDLAAGSAVVRFRTLLATGQ